MAQFEYWMTTDLKRGSSQVQVLHGQTFTQDNLGNRVGVVVLDGGEPATLSGTVTGYVIRADGGTVLVTGAVDGNKAYIDLPESAYAVPGQIQIAIRLTSGSTKTVLGALNAYVQRTATGTIIDPGHVVPSLDELLAQIDAMEQGTAAANQAASAANTAASNADAKATLADQKATLANTAAAGANQAADQAAGAAYNADQKAALADQKATLADQKATLANTAAEAADQAADAATDAATAANTAAQNANNATGYIAPSETTSTASAAHAQGSYLIYDGKLYQATADIAIGDTLATTGSGANIAQVTGGAMGEVADLKSALTSYNSYNILALYGTHTDGTSDGVTRTWIDNETVKLTNTATGNGSINLLVANTALPPYFKQGETYSVKITKTIQTPFVRFTFYNGASTTNVDKSADSTITVPSNCTGIIIALRFANGTAFSNDTVKIVVNNAQSNAELESVLRTTSENLSTLSDNVTSLSDDVTANTTGISRIKNQFNRNSYDITKIYGNLSTGTSGGVTFTWDETTGRFTVTSSSLSAENKVIIAGFSAIPSYMELGKTYKVKCSTSSTDVFLRISYFKSNVEHATDYTADGSYTLPSDAEGFVVMLRTKSTGSSINATISFGLFNAKTNEELESEIDELANTITYQKNNTKYLPFVSARRATIALILDVVNPYNKAMYEVCKDHGGVCGFAISAGNYTPDTHEDYLQWQKEGCEIISHGTYIMNQYGYKGQRVNGEIQYTSITDAEAEAIFRSEYNNLADAGFFVNGFVGSNGKVADEYVPMLKRIYDYASTEPNHSATSSTPGYTESCFMYGTDHPYHIWRYSLETATVAQAKSAIDRALQYNTTCIFYCHATDTAVLGNFSPENLDEILDYADSKYLKLVSPYDAVKNVFAIRYDDIVTGN